LSICVGLARLTSEDKQHSLENDIMKSMLMRKADSDTENGVLPTEGILQAMAVG